MSNDLFLSDAKKTVGSKGKGPDGAAGAYGATPSTIKPVPAKDRGYQKNAVVVAPGKDNKVVKGNMKPKGKKVPKAKK